MSPVRTRVGARGVIDLVLDADSFECWDTAPDYSTEPQDYRRELERAAARSGVDEAVLTGRGTVAGRPVVVVVGEFAFLGGSIGRAAAARVVAALRRATTEGLAVLASTASGGTRMQEGAPAFWQMTEITRAVMAHRRAGLPYLVHLRHPTTGGVYASWGSLGQITFAEPGALVGFLGPRVHAGLTGAAFPDGIQTAEHLAAHGVIDTVVSTEELRTTLERTLALLMDPAGAPTQHPRSTRPRRVPQRARSAWEIVETTRRPDRIGVHDLLGVGAPGAVLFGGSDGGVVVALTRLDEQPCVFVGQQRTRRLGPEALRAARRGMLLAEELRLPLVTVVDTPGAECSPRAEEQAIAREIARCMATLAELTVPTVAVLIGQGSGGGALALLPARRVIAVECSWLSPLPPEGASIIVHGHAGRAADLAATQRVRAVDLLEAGIVHTLVCERDEGPASDLADAVLAEIGHALRTDTRPVSDTPPGSDRLAEHSPRHAAGR